MKIAMYARYSTDKQSEASIEDQFRRCGLAAKQHGLDINSVDKYYDEALSGTSKHTCKRNGYQGLLSAWERRDFDVLIVTETSRLSRDALETAELQDRIEKSGVWFITADGINSKLPNWQLLLGIHGIVSQQSIRDTQGRVSNAMYGKLENGYMIGPPAYGYKIYKELKEDGRNKGTIWKKDSDKSQILMEIFGLRLKGYSFNGIAEVLNDRGVPPPRPRAGKECYWRPGTVKKIISNPIYRGVFVWHDSSTYKKKISDSLEESKPEEFERPELRLVDDATWYSCNRKSSISRTGYGGGQHIYSGLANCGVCGAVLSIATGGGVPSLTCAQCYQARRVGIDRQYNGYLSVNGLRVALEEALDNLFSESVIDEFRNRLRSRLTQGYEEELSRATLEYEKANRACDRLARAIRTIDTTDDKLIEQYKEASELLEKYKARLDSIKENHSLIDKVGIKKQLEVDPRTLLSEIWEGTLPVEHVRSMLTRIFDEVVFESKPQKKTSIVRIKYSVGIIAAMASDTSLIDAMPVSMRFQLKSNPSNPKGWDIDRLPCNTE